MVKNENDPLSVLGSILGIDVSRLGALVDSGELKIVDGSAGSPQKDMAALFNAVQSAPAAAERASADINGSALALDAAFMMQTNNDMCFPAVISAGKSENGTERYSVIVCDDDAHYSAFVEKVVEVVKKLLLSNNEAYDAFDASMLEGRMPIIQIVAALSDVAKKE